MLFVFCRADEFVIYMKKNRNLGRSFFWFIMKSIRIQPYVYYSNPDNKLNVVT
jgi:hypothetical protein